MNKTLFLSVVSGCSLLLLSGCSLFSDNAQDYLQAESKPDIVLPADVQQLTLEEKWVVPKAAQPENLPETFEPPRPVPLNVAAMQVDKEEERPDTWSKEVNTRLVQDGNGSPILRLDVGFPQAWARVGEALKERKIVIEDLDRSVGTYYILLNEDAVSQSDEQDGWFAKPSNFAYEVKVNRARSGVYVALHEDADNLADNDFAREFLESLQSAIADDEEL